jgi:hypothetical protein
MAEKEKKSANVVMVHPVSKGRAVATRRAFDNVWSKRGWTIETKAAAAKEEAKSGSSE